MNPADQLLHEASTNLLLAVKELRWLLNGEARQIIDECIRDAEQALQNARELDDK